MCMRFNVYSLEKFEDRNAIVNIHTYIIVWTWIRMERQRKEHRWYSLAQTAHLQWEEREKLNIEDEKHKLHRMQHIKEKSAPTPWKKELSEHSLAV